MKRITIQSGINRAAWIFSAVALLTANSWAESAPFNLGRDQDVGARALGLGGAYTAVANDFTALYYNPAGLTSVKQHELHFSLQQDRLSGTGRSGGFAPHSLEQQNLKIQSLGYLVPVPTVRGGLSFAFGMYKPRTFDEVISFRDAQSATVGPYEYRAAGDMTHYRAGMAVDIAEGVVLGVAAGYVHGREEVRVEDNGRYGYLRTYGGYNLEPALLLRLNDNLRFGASLVIKEAFGLEEVFEDETSNSEGNYVVKHPMTLKMGLAHFGKSHLLSLSYKTHNWENYRYGRNDVEFTDLVSYRNEHELAVGAEQYIPLIGGVVRGGYTYNLLPDKDFNPAYNRHRVAGGVGFIMGGSLSLDLGYSFSFWELQDADLYQENREHRAMMSFAYRY